MEPKYIEQTEDGYLYEIAGIIHAAMVAKDIEVALLAVHHLHTEVYPRMHQFGFESKQSIRQRIDDWKAGKPDLDKEARTLRVEQWKEKGIAQEQEKSSLTDRFSAFGRLPGNSWMDRLGIGNAKETPIPDDKEPDHELDKE